jgi:hypothetical protein
MYSVSITSSDVKMYLESILYVCHPAALDIITGEIKCLQHKEYMLQTLHFQNRGHLLMMALDCSKQIEDSSIETNKDCSFSHIYSKCYNLTTYFDLRESS